MAIPVNESDRWTRLWALRLIDRTGRYWGMPLLGYVINLALAGPLADGSDFIKQ